MSIPAFAQQSGVNQVDDLSGHEGIEINGLVVDETITKVGRDFYELFYQQWEAPASTLGFTLFIRERPVPGLGSQIMVHLNETEIFNQAVQPRYDVVEGMAQYAAQLAYQYVLNYESIVKQLGSEDQQGSGVF